MHGAQQIQALQQGEASDVNHWLNSMAFTQERSHLWGVLQGGLQGQQSKGGCLGVADGDWQVGDGGVESIHTAQGCASGGVNFSLGTSNDQNGSSDGQDCQVGVEVDRPCAGEDGQGGC